VLVLIVGSVMGVVFLLQLTLVNQRNGPLSDFGRDLVAISAIERGETPFQVVTDIDPTVTARMPSGIRPNEWLVAHTYPALGVALAFDRAVDLPLERQEHIARIAGLALVIAEAIAFGSLLARGGSPPYMQVLIPGLFLSSIMVVEDTRWIQHAALVGLLSIGAIVAAESNDRRVVSYVLLGLAVSLRPWLAPLALGLPGRRSVFKDGIGVGSMAAAGTMVSIPFTGGWGTIPSWLDALAANHEAWSGWRGNLAIWSGVSATIGLAAYVVILIAVATLAGHMQPYRRPFVAAASVLLATPLIWPHYLVAITPVLVYSTFVRRRRTVEVAAIGGLSLAIVGVLRDALQPGWVYGPPWLAALFMLLGGLTLGTALRWRRTREGRAVGPNGSSSPDDATNDSSLQAMRGS
jgi:hypothetical protein